MALCLSLIAGSIWTFICLCSSIELHLIISTWTFQKAGFVSSEFTAHQNWGEHIVILPKVREYFILVMNFVLSYLRVLQRCSPCVIFYRHQDQKYIMVVHVDRPNDAVKQQGGSTCLINCHCFEGFHYYRKELDAMENPEEAHARRGAHWTFNADQFVQAVKSLKQEGMSLK